MALARSTVSASYVVNHDQAKELGASILKSTSARSCTSAVFDTGTAESVYVVVMFRLLGVRELWRGIL